MSPRVREGLNAGGRDGPLADRRGGGCEIRTREGLHPTRFPTLLAGVHHRSLPFMACPDLCWAATGEWLRTGVNEPRTEPMPGSESWR